MQLPPLNALRTFEVVGRLGSIRAAANELVVTPGAVSRQIRVLEAWLGLALFRREGRTVRLTDVGARYLESASEHLAAIATATGQVTGRWRSEEVLQVRSYTLFANQWLIPRLAGFHRVHPWVELELVTSNRLTDFGRFDVDAEIRGEPDLWPDGFDADLLITDDIVLVCSPGFRDEYRLQEPDDLRRLPADCFLRSVAAPQVWRDWLAITGTTHVKAAHGPRFGDTSLSYRAAAAGQGVTLAPRAFVHSELAAATLVMPFEVRGQEINFFLVHPTHRPHRRAFTVFRRWLLAEARESARSA